MIPYGRQWIDEEDIQAVVQVLRSPWLTTGPMVEAFEEGVARFVGAEKAVSFSSGTAALHGAMWAAGISSGDEVILPPMTFVATANAVVFQGGKPVFADVDPEALLIDPGEVEAKITPRTKAIVAVDYAGHPCDYDALRQIADRRGLILIADSCHSLGAGYKGRKIGTLADLTVFSFHPVKAITTGEGGMAVTNDRGLAERMRRFRNHGLTADRRERAAMGTWRYEMEDLGFNYRLSDFQCALGLSQLRKVPAWVERRRKIAGQYDSALAEYSILMPLAVSSSVWHAYHLYVLQLVPHHPEVDQSGIFQFFREWGIGVNVHYLPVHLHPFYRSRFGTGPGLCPRAERAYERILSIPIFPAMTEEEVLHVIRVMGKAEKSWGR